MACGLPEVNADIATKLVLACGVLSGASLLSAIIGLFGKVSEKREKIKNAAGTDSQSGLPYQPNPKQQKLLAYKLSTRIYILLATGIAGVIAIVVYSVVAAGDPQLLEKSLACTATWALWIGLFCAAVSPFLFVGFIRYIVRLHKETGDIN